ncbi:hypothetical protein RI129_010781 [Pyrocoelia pectoralis]|uniref:YqaJ viral recombinase domain-containing protein n=1 Tax=Pyrocoelia pectoralis TaxID=417401 RepID=A0AAN7UZG9_9COLE
MGKMNFFKEQRNGFRSQFIFKCDICERRICVTSHVPEDDINFAFVWGITSIGAGYSQGEELFSVLNVPFMTKRKYKKVESLVSADWEKRLVREMHSNALAERRIAIESGHISNGIPYITVVVDGGWAKRSYGHSYSSLSGVACIIGQKTRKLLYVGVKNKFCYMCATSTREHVCYKNFHGSSSSMEQAIIVDGFNLSEQDYGLHYKFVVGDGDSSVYTRIIERVSYGRSVIKLECANHATRAVTSNLYKLIKNTTFDVAARNSVSNLQRDIKNAPLHAFGNHSNCSKEVCKSITTSSENHVPLLQSSGIWTELTRITGYIEKKAERLVGNYTTNFAEGFMAKVAKFTGGKRTNLIQRNIYRTRCFGAALSYNHSGNIHTSLLKSDVDEIYLNRYCMKKRKAVQQRRKCSKKVKKSSNINDDSADYGDAAAQPDISEEEFQQAKIRIIEELQKTNLDTVHIKTIGQRENIVWFEERRNRLTASMFGKICKRRSTTPTDGILKELFYRSNFLKTSAIVYGIENEENAIAKFSAQTKMTIQSCGLFVDSKYVFLGASPDGIVDEEVLVEVKCLYSIRNLKIKEAVVTNKNICVHVVNDTLVLKRNHNYFYQIQGQLYICNKKYCYLILYTDKDLEYIRIERDDNFCSEMLVKLNRFWQDHALPELADPRIPRNMKTR